MYIFIFERVYFVCRVVLACRFGIGIECVIYCRWIRGSKGISAACCGNKFIFPPTSFPVGQIALVCLDCSGSVVAI